MKIWDCFSASTPPRRAGLSFTLTTLVLSMSAAACCAQSNDPKAALTPTSGKTQSSKTEPAGDAQRVPAPKLAAAVRAPAVSKPAWKDLTTGQQEALKPLTAQWDSLSGQRKRKWLEISKNYGTLSPTEQAKLHSRMSAWVALSPQQREQARLTFSQTKDLTAEEKTSNWQAYQALSPAEKQKLAGQAPSTPAGAAVVKPTPAKKLAEVPVVQHEPKLGAKLATAPAQPSEQKTLLPKNRLGADTTPAPKQ